MMPLQLPRLLFDYGSVRFLVVELAALRIRHPLLVTDQGVVRVGIFARIRSLLDGSFPYTVFDTVSENPTFEGVDRATERYRSESCDSVLAIGGGSVIDTAKLVAVLGGHPGSAVDYVGHSDRVTEAVVPLVVIPTTAGTGSEASPDAGIHPNPKTISSGITSSHVVPRVAVCDPELTFTLPPRLTAATGLDALSHCIEGYSAKTVSPLADALALDGVRRICHFLPEATLNGTDRAARWQVMMAAFEGGVAIGKGLGPAHAIAISCGDQGLHHGLLSAIGLVASMRLMSEHAPERVADIAAAMGLSADKSVADAVLELMLQLGLPGSLRDMGYVPRDFKRLARAASENHFNLTSPYAPNEVEFAQLLSEVLG